MFIAAFLIGFYSYIIFFLGIFGWLYKDIIIWLSALFFWSIALFIRKKIKKFHFNSGEKNFYLLFIIFCLLALVNSIGTAGPELGFDALWYHLTLPKLYLLYHKIIYIPGGLLYYSAMPKLAEMLYIGALSFGNESLPKFIQFLFGLLTCFALYKVERKFLNPFISFIGVIIFYSNLVVAWESSSAYIDLIRTFFEVMALWGFINWWESQDKKWLIISAFMLGFEITTKLPAIGSLLIFSLLIIYYSLRNKRGNLIIRLFTYWIIALAVPLPWFIFSYVNTGNPFFPLFSVYLNQLNNKVLDSSLLSPVHFLQTSWNVLTQAADPISPLYLIFLPFIILFVFNKTIKYRYLFAYSFLGFIVWYFTSRIEGTRMLLPYLPVFSLLIAGCIDEIFKQKNQYGRSLVRIVLCLVILTSIITIGYRFEANRKYLPVILGKQTREAFLSERLNFSFGDFYDTDGYFKTHIKPSEVVLLYGFHNLYYVNFPFVDSSWIKKNQKFDYIATQKTDLPKEFNNWKLIYKNDTTMVKLYSHK